MRLNAEGVVSIGSRAELFVDDFMIDRLENAELKLNPPKKQNIAFEYNEIWESGGAYPTIIKDGNEIRMYYRGVAGLKDHDPRQTTCIAYSYDNGVTFERPIIGKIEFMGSTANNIIRRGPECGNFAPFLDRRPGVPADERYKAVGGVASAEADYNEGTLYGYISADGIDFTRVQKQPILTFGTFDSQNLAFWDTNINRYRSYSRYFSPTRTRAIQSACSDDFQVWDPVVPNDYGGAPEQHFYTNGTIQCPGAEHMYLSFPKRFWRERQRERKAPYNGISEALFMSSRDGVHWDRRFEDAWVRPGLDELNWYDRSNMPANGVLETSEREISAYISEHNRTDSRLRRMTIRKHGFASVHAGYAGGHLKTRPFTFEGSTLYVNFATAAFGSLRFALADEAGSVIPGYEFEHFRTYTGDYMYGAIEKLDGRDLSMLSGKPVCLLMELKDADVYSFRFGE